jgi:cytoskeletal protein RodZ
MVGLEPQSLRVIEGSGAAADQSEPPAEHVGAFLREARANTGCSLADIAATLRIRAKFLQAIEDGRYEDLPGPTYAAGFIRSYADYLGLDTAALLAQFKTEPSGAEGQPDLEFPAPSTVGWFPTGTVVASCAVLAAAVFATAARCDTGGHGQRDR